MPKKNCQQDTNSDACSFQSRSRSVVSALKMLPSYSYSRYSNSTRSLSRDGSKRKRMKNSYVEIFNEKKMYNEGGKKNDSFGGSTWRKGKSCYVTLDKDLSYHRYDGDTIVNKNIVSEKELIHSNSNHEINNDYNSQILCLNENAKSKDSKSKNVQDNVNEEEVHLREQSVETFGMNSCIGNIMNNSPDDKQEHTSEQKHEYIISQPLFIDELDGKNNKNEINNNDNSGRNEPFTFPIQSSFLDAKEKSKTTPILPEQLNFSEHSEQQPQQEQQKQEPIIQNTQKEDNITNILPTSTLTEPQHQLNNLKTQTESKFNNLKPILINNSYTNQPQIQSAQTELSNLKPILTKTNNDNTNQQQKEPLIEQPKISPIIKTKQYIQTKNIFIKPLNLNPNASITINFNTIHNNETSNDIIKPKSTRINLNNKTNPNLEVDDMITNIIQKFKLVKGYHKDQNYLNVMNKYNARCKIPLLHNTFEEAERTIHINKHKKRLNTHCNLTNNNITYYNTSNNNNKKRTRKISDIINYEINKEKEGHLQRRKLFSFNQRDEGCYSYVEGEVIARNYLNGLMKRKRVCSLNVKKNITMPVNTMDNMIEVREAQLFRIGNEREMGFNL